MAETVVLLHGLATSPERTWVETGLVDLLTDAGRQVTAPLLPGHGPGASTEPATYDGLVEQAIALLPAEPVDLVGFSMGAQLALRITLTAPERVDRLVLAGLGTNAFEPSDARPVREVLERGTPGDDVVTGHFLQLARESGNDPLALAALLTRPLTAVTVEALSRITKPTLVVIGERDFVAPADALADGIPGAQLVVLPGVDHFQTPKSFAFVDAVLGFLDAAPG